MGASPGGLGGGSICQGQEIARMSKMTPCHGTIVTCDGIRSKCVPARVVATTLAAT